MCRHKISLVKDEVILTRAKQIDNETVNPFTRCWNVLFNPGERDASRKFARRHLRLVVFLRLLEGEHVVRPGSRSHSERRLCSSAEKRERRETEREEEREKESEGERFILVTPVTLSIPLWRRIRNSGDDPTTVFGDSLFFPFLPLTPCLLTGVLSPSLSSYFTTLPSLPASQASFHPVFLFSLVLSFLSSFSFSSFLSFRCSLYIKRLTFP